MSELLENLKKLRNNGSRKQAHIDLACRCINEVEKLEDDLKSYKHDHTTVINILLDCINNGSAEDAYKTIKEIADHYEQMKEKGYE